MASSAKAKAAARKPLSPPKSADGPSRLAEYLLARTPAEDVAAYEPAVLSKAAGLAHRAVTSGSLRTCDPTRRAHFRAST